MGCSRSLLDVTTQILDFFGIQQNRSFVSSFQLVRADVKRVRMRVDDDRLLPG